MSDEPLQPSQEASDPRKAKTLDEAARNPDGTYNGLRALSWLSDIVTGGKGIPLNEVEQIADDVKNGWRRNCSLPRSRSTGNLRTGGNPLRPTCARDLPGRE